MAAEPLAPSPLTRTTPIRESTFRELQRDREGVRERGETSATCLVGGVDLGKAWIVETALREAEADGFETLLCRADPDQAMIPLSLFRGALASRHRGGTPRPTEGGTSTGPEGAASPSSGFELSALVLQAAIPARPPVEEERAEETHRAEQQYQRLISSLSDPNQTAQDKRARLLTQIRTFLVDQAKEAPLVLALADLQAADHVSADLVAVLLEWRPKAPLWMLLSYTAEEDLYPPLRRALERTFLSQVAVRRPVTPLSAGELRLFLLEEAGLRAPLPGGVLDEVVRRAQGLPGVALRLVRSYQTQGALPGLATPVADGGSASPWTNLTEDQDRVLALTAVAGASAGFELLRRAAGEEEEKMAELLEELVQRGLLEERPGGIYAFAEESARLRVYQDLTAARRRVLHRKVAEALETLPGSADPARIFLLAHHYANGKVDAQAIKFLQEALRLARGAGALPREQALLRQLLEIHLRAHGEDRRGEAALLHQLGVVAYALSSDEEAAQALARARDLLQNLHETGTAYCAVLLDLARVTVRRGDAAVAQKLAEEALAGFQHAEDPLGAAVANRFLSRLSYATGDYEDSSERLRSCLEGLRRVQAPKTEVGRTLTALADSGFMHDRASRAESTRKLEEGIRLCLEDGDTAGALFAELGRFSIERVLGDLPASRETEKRIEKLLPEVPEAWRLQEGMLRKGANHIQKGEVKEALGICQAAGELAHLMGDKEREGKARIFVVDAQARAGEFELAERLAHEALEIGKAIDHPRTQAEALIRLAMAAQMRGNLEEARELLGRAELLGEGLELSKVALNVRRQLREGWELSPET